MVLASINVEEQQVKLLHRAVGESTKKKFVDGILYACTLVEENNRKRKPNGGRKHLTYPTHRRRKRR